MKDSKVYLQAAMRIDDGNEVYSCHAMRWLNPEAVYKYSRVMQTRATPFANVCALDIEDAACEVGITPRDLRVMMLCMMAACCEDFE